MIPPTRRERFIRALQFAGSAALDEIPYGPVIKPPSTTGAIQVDSDYLSSVR